MAKTASGAEDFSFKPFKKGGFLRLQKQLENPEKLLRPIGMLLLADSQKAFKEQRLGDIIWPERYPAQSPPKVNVAGIVDDFNKGRKNPPRRRFEGRPALKDTGALRRSLTAAKAVKVQGFVIQVGSSLEYAKRAHDGGVSKQPVGEKTKDLLEAFLKKKKNFQYHGQLGFLFGVDELRTKVRPRPFTGITDQAKKRIIRFLQFKLSPPLQGGLFQEGFKI